MHQPIDDVIQLERFYSRRNRFVLVANFGSSEVDLAPIGRIYSGGELVLDTSNSLPHLLNTDVQFKSVTLSPFEAKDTSFALCFISNIGIFLSHSNHNTLVT